MVRTEVESSVAATEADAEFRDGSVLPLDVQRDDRTPDANGTGEHRRSDPVHEPEPTNSVESSIPTAEEATDPPDGSEHNREEVTERRVARRGNRERPRAPRAGRSTPPSNAAASPERGENQDLDPVEAHQVAETPTGADALVIDLSGKSKRGARTVRRAHKKEQAASAAVEAADDNPALGALNRHLNMMMQQLSTAHRVIGRVAAERDALRQQLADLQGIPVEEIVVTNIGTATSEQPAKSPSSSDTPEPTPPKSVLSRLNYFGGDDYAVMKKRRQMFALAILGVLTIIWIVARMGYISVNQNLSRESLTALPVIGDLMYFFLAGWILFRVVKVSSKGVRWVFPSEDQKRRRR